MLNQIKQDHINAKNLAEGINNIDGLSVDYERISTNILYFNIDSNFKRYGNFEKQSSMINSYPFEI